MGNACQATQVNLTTEISDESTMPQIIMQTSDRVIFKEIYKKEKAEVHDKSYSSPQLTHLPLLNLDIIEPDQFFPQIKPSKRTLSFVNDKTQRQIVKSRTPSHKPDPDTISITKQPIKSSLKSINSKIGSSNKSQKSVRWGSDLSVFLNLTHYQNLQI
ncbi:unnamed protein product [Paramecium primaurelia]|uniref:Uncharacterized protein n=1 Tax=Paramecium primaurelia TaxID=5886 RepID=A0A8S1JQ67_PARPR|nr:unnamed protein product [Paramecium primaurelia]